MVRPRFPGETKMYAHYYASRTRKTVLITNSPALNAPLAEIEVARKAGARRVAAKYNAKPWNF